MAGGETRRDKTRRDKAMQSLGVGEMIRNSVTAPAHKLQQPPPTQKV